jgi:hypothetical protein
MTALAASDHDTDVWPEDRIPTRGTGITVACGEQRHDHCPGVRVWDQEPWGPCTCRCHNTQPIQEETP